MTSAQKHAVFNGPLVSPNQAFQLASPAARYASRCSKNFSIGTPLRVRERNYTGGTRGRSDLIVSGQVMVAFAALLGCDGPDSSCNKTDGERGASGLSYSIRSQVTRTHTAFETFEGNTAQGCSLALA